MHGQTMTVCWSINWQILRVAMSLVRHKISHLVQLDLTHAIPSSAPEDCAKRSLLLTQKVEDVSLEDRDSAKEATEGQVASEEADGSGASSSEDTPVSTSFARTSSVFCILS
jgi:hypothetical protein